MPNHNAQGPFADLNVLHQSYCSASTRLKPKAWAKAAAEETPRGDSSKKMGTAASS